QTIGDEWPRPGMSAVQRMFFAGPSADATDHSIGRLFSSEMPSPPGPRHCGHWAASCAVNPATITALHAPRKIRREKELIGLPRSSLEGTARAPRWNLMPIVGIHRFHWSLDLVPPVGEQIADEEIGDGAAKIGVLADELPEAEAGVVLADEPPHAIHAGVEVRRPFPELGARRVAALQAFDDRVRRQLAGLQRQQHA